MPRWGTSLRGVRNNRSPLSPQKHRPLVPQPTVALRAHSPGGPRWICVHWVKGPWPWRPFQAPQRHFLMPEHLEMFPRTGFELFTQGRNCPSPAQGQKGLKSESARRHPHSPPITSSRPAAGVSCEGTSRSLMEAAPPLRRNSILTPCSTQSSACVGNKTLTCLGLPRHKPS